MCRTIRSARGSAMVRNRATFVALINPNVGDLRNILCTTVPAIASIVHSWPRLASLWVVTRGRLGADSGLTGLQEGDCSVLGQVSVMIPPISSSRIPAAYGIGTARMTFSHSASWEQRGLRTCHGRADLRSFRRRRRCFRCSARFRAHIAKRLGLREPRWCVSSAAAGRVRGLLQRYEGRAPSARCPSRVSCARWSHIAMHEGR